MSCVVFCSLFVAVITHILTKAARNFIHLMVGSINRPYFSDNPPLRENFGEILKKSTILRTLNKMLFYINGSIQQNSNLVLFLLFFNQVYSLFIIHAIQDVLAYRYNSGTKQKHPKINVPCVHNMPRFCLVYHLCGRFSLVFPNG